MKKQIEHEIEAARIDGPLPGRGSSKTVLVIEFDVAGFTDRQVDALLLETTVQGEGHGGQYAHPTAAVSSRRRGDRVLVELDVSGFSESEIDSLSGEVQAQGESSEDHPDAPVLGSRVVRRRS